MLRKKKNLLVIGFMVIALVGIGLFLYQRRASNSLSFEECSKRYGATRSYPGKCTTPDGKVITQPVNKGTYKGNCGINPRAYPCYIPDSELHGNN